MNFNRKPKREPKPEPGQDPGSLVANGTAEFLAVLARRDKGEFQIDAMEVGATNSQWIFRVSRRAARAVQLMLLL